jgi:negative regulator of genetic competence, sporulation and motility
MADKVSPTERLVGLAGDDVLKRPKVTEEIFKEVMSEIRKERSDKAKAKARELIVKALDLQEQMEKAEKEFRSQKAKFEKELGKILNQLENDLNQAAGGQPPAQEEEAPQE